QMDRAIGRPSLGNSKPEIGRSRDTEDRHVTRFRKHWQALPTGNRVGVALSLTAFVLITIALAVQIRGFVAGLGEPVPTPVPALDKRSGAAAGATGFFPFARGGNHP